MKTQITVLAAAILMTTGLSAPATAQYPDQTINVMIPFSAGGGTDVPGRFFAQEMEEILGTDIIVTNVEGAGGVIGATQLSQADPDGYSLGFMPVGTTTTQPHMRETEYGADSWEPICLVAQGPMYVTVPADSDIQSIDDLVQQAQDSNVVTAGPPPGSLPHIGQAALAQMLGVDFNYIPHEGINAVAQSMLGGRVHMTVWFADAGERFGLRPLAILDSTRSEELPDIPTLAELGYENIENYVWFGFFAPAGTPAEIVTTLAEACDQAVHSEGFTSNMDAANRQVRYMPTDEFAEFFASQFAANGERLRSLGLAN